MPLREREPDEVGARAGSGGAHGVADVRAQRAQAHVERLGDLLVEFAPPERLDDLPLPLRELGGRAQPIVSALPLDPCQAWNASAVMTTSGARALWPRPGVSISTSTAVRPRVSGLRCSLSRSSRICRWL